MKRWLGFFLCLLGYHFTWANTQLATGEPVVTEDGTGVPFFLFSSDNITAGQFDLALPDGWSLKSVEIDPRFNVTHELDSDQLGSGVLRMVFYSLDNTPLTGGTLGQVILEAPDSQPPLTVPDFTNPLFADPNGDAFGLSGGFPSLQILSSPQSVSIVAGQSAQLSVSVVGIDPVYQWYEGQSGETGSPVGTGSGIFQTPALTDTTLYWVRVTDSFGGLVDSGSATVTVTGELPLTLTPNFATVSPLSGSSSFSVSAGPTTQWTATTTANWVTINSGSGTGAGVVSYSFASNSGMSIRNATISVGDATFTITQNAAVSPFDSVPPLGGNVLAWKAVPGVGLLTDGLFPYVYHSIHGWLYFHHDGPGDAYQIYSLNADFGWIMTGALFTDGSESWLYSYESQSFLLLLPGSSPRLRRLYDPVSDQVITVP